MWLFTVWGHAPQLCSVLSVETFSLHHGCVLCLFYKAFSSEPRIHGEILVNSHWLNVNSLQWRNIGEFPLTQYQISPMEKYWWIPIDPVLNFSNWEISEDSHWLNINSLQWRNISGFQLILNLSNFINHWQHILNNYYFSWKTFHRLVTLGIKQ